jgi:hypothetical protein
MPAGHRRLLWFIDGGTVVIACSSVGLAIGLHHNVLTPLTWTFALVGQIAARRVAYQMAARWRRIAELHEQKFQMLLEAMASGVVVAIQASDERRPSVH